MAREEPLVLGYTGGGPGGQGGAAITMVAISAFFVLLGSMLLPRRSRSLLAGRSH